MPEAVPFSKLREISPRVAVDYKDRSHRTLLRDIQELLRMGLVAYDDKGKAWRAKREAILAFLPVRASSAKE
jgi:predicted transcriptional regulator